MENIKQEIQKQKQTYISLNTLEQIIQGENYIDLVNKINNLISDGIIMPIKNKRNTNGKIPSLFMKYRIIKEENEEIKREIKHLSPELNIEKYLNHPEIYQKQRTEILQLDTFLKNKKEKLSITISKNERAYQIWGYEKMLDTPIGKSILQVNQIQNMLNYYLTPEPLFDYIPEQKEQMTILIIENKDSWYTLRKIVKKRALKTFYLLGQPIHGLIYGEGNKITKLKAVQNYETEMLNTKAKFLYWGDIDFTGIDMYQRVKKANINTDIQVFTNIYEKMLEMAENKKLGQIHKAQNKQINLIDFLENFKTVQIQEKIKKILEQNTYIPQEILNYEELEKMIQ